MDRRHFLSTASKAALAFALLPRSTFAGTPATTLRIALDRPLAAMPPDFIGFSYESAQLADPTYFSSSNAPLIAQFRKLSPRGVLRLGGNLSDLTLWAGTSNSPAQSIPERANISTRFEWRIVGARAAAHRPATITPESIRALGSFLRATGWGLIYGLNLGTGSPERAAEEAACVAESTGDSLLAFQVGNEPDLFGRSLRSHAWNFARYWDEYQTFVRAVRARVRLAPFAGPDVAGNVDWTKQFAARAKGDAHLLTSHYYAMGPPESSKMNAQRLLHDDPHLLHDIPELVAIAKSAGMSHRVSEGNSCYHAGKVGVSDTFASALWAADYLLFLAQSGCAGVNLHTGGEAFYSAFVEDGRQLRERPIFFGMQFTQQFAGATFLESSLEGRINASAYVARRGDQLLLALVNKDSVPLEVTVSGLSTNMRRITENWTLAAPSLSSTTERSPFIEWGQTNSQGVLPTLRLLPYAARVLTLT
jgi:hypothetical protein